ncbi:MAG: ribosome maturation factor RimP [Candidatus Zixiibacteriota bacterium]
MKVDREKEQIVELITVPLEGIGIEIADAVLSRHKAASLLRLYVYTEEGMTLERCAKASRLVGELIEQSDLLERGYTLEVSSPGLDRPLQTAVDFKYRVGETVRVRFAAKNRKPLTGRIVSTTSASVELEHEGEHWSVPLDDIDSARIIY